MEKKKRFCCWMTIIWMHTKENGQKSVAGRGRFAIYNWMVFRGGSRQQQIKKEEEEVEWMGSVYIPRRLLINEVYAELTHAHQTTGNPGSRRRNPLGHSSKREWLDSKSEAHTEKKKKVTRSRSRWELGMTTIGIIGRDNDKTEHSRERERRWAPYRNVWKENKRISMPLFNPKQNSRRRRRMNFWKMHNNGGTIRLSNSTSWRGQSDCPLLWTKQPHF